MKYSLFPSASAWNISWCYVSCSLNDLSLSQLLKNLCCAPKICSTTPTVNKMSSLNCLPCSSAVTRETVALLLAFLTLGGAGAAISGNCCTSLGFLNSWRGWSCHLYSHHVHTAAGSYSPNQPPSPTPAPTRKAFFLFKKCKMQ